MTSRSIGPCYRRTMGIRAVAAVALAVSALSPIAPIQDGPKPKRIDIAITEKGFEPESVTVEKGVAIELAFTRKTDKTCATEIAVPSLKLKQALPLNQAVVVALTPDKDDVSFACGMNMLRGKIVVK